LNIPPSFQGVHRRFDSFENIFLPPHEGDIEKAFKKDAI